MSTNAAGDPLRRRTSPGLNFLTHDHADVARVGAGSNITTIRLLLERRYRNRLPAALAEKYNGTYLHDPVAGV
jgi:hypothetical protein